MSKVDLKRFAPFADLSDGERVEVAAVLEGRELSPGETLFHEGDEADAMVLVTEGMVELSRTSSAVKALLPMGSVLGGLSLFAVGTREATACGGPERARVVLLRREDWRRLAEDFPRVACRIAEAILADVATHTRAALASLQAASVDPSGSSE